MSYDTEHPAISPACSRLVSEGLLEVWEYSRSVTSWTGLQKVVDRLECRCPPDNRRPAWSFRGEGEWKKDIESSLEKDAFQHRIELSKLYHDRVEQGIIRRFKREFVRMSNSQPADNDHMAWLSIMQHHGAPTRLVDITYSIYVALYFALWKYRHGQKAAVWCFNNDWLCDGWDESPPHGFKTEFARDKEGRYIKLYEIVLGCTDPKVYIINPYHMPERLVLQQGGFLLPLDITKPFMENLLHMPKNPRGNKGKRKYDPRIVKLQILLNELELEEVRYRLLRMNINNATLFPGLDGFARSLRDRIPFEEQRAGLKKGFTK